MTLLSSDFLPDPLAQSAAATVTPLPPGARFALRVRAGERPRLATALGLELPPRIGRRAAAEGAEALCLGPDEWVLVAPEAAAARIVTACADVYADAPHSLTEISDREITLRIDGPRAAELLTLGCPRDLDAVAPGEGRRTVFDGVTVVLWRDGAQDFRLDVWRSFAPHVLDLLVIGCRELALD